MQTKTGLVKLLGGLFGGTLAADPNIVRLLRQEHARENVVILRDLVHQGNVHYLDCHACDRKGEEFLKNLYRSMKFMDQVIRVKRLPPGTVVRLRVLIGRHRKSWAPSTATTPIRRRRCSRRSTRKSPPS